MVSFVVVVFVLFLYHGLMLMAFLVFEEYILCFLTAGMESNSQSVQQHTEGKKKHE